MNEFVIASSIVSLFASTFCLVRIFYISVEIAAQKKSTHNIQFVPVDQLKDFRMNDDELAQANGSLISDEQRKKLMEDPFDEI
jgi:hypothetical protein